MSVTALPNSGPVIFPLITPNREKSDRVKGNETGEERAEDRILSDSRMSLLIDAPHHCPCGSRSAFQWLESGASYAYCWDAL
jgi:hypothetical protein